MEKQIIRVLIHAIAIFAGAYLLPWVSVDGPGAALVVAIILALINAILRPIMVVLTLPVTVVTLGLFLWVINGLMILLADAIHPGFHVSSLGGAMLFSLVVWLIKWVLGGTEKK